MLPLGGDLWRPRQSDITYSGRVNFNLGPIWTLIVIVVGAVVIPGLIYAMVLLYATLLGYAGG